MIVRRATSADRPRLCVTAMRSFHDDPVMRWLYPDDDEYFRPGGEVFRGAMTTWVVQQEVWCTDDAAALAVWFAPRLPDSPEPPEVAVEPPVAAPSPELLRRFELLGQLMAEHRPDETHWYLQLLGTHPDWQRQGLGAALMQPVLEREDGLGCYLETETADNVAYYRRHGFDVRSEWDVDPGGESGAVGPHMWGMWRPAR